MEADLVTPFEAESFVRSLQEVDVREYGGYIWVRQLEYLQKLNYQSHRNAKAREDEFVMDAVVTEDKVGVLIHQALVAEVWKSKVFPLLKPALQEVRSAKPYLMLYYQGVLLSFLEALMYHRSVIDTAEDLLVDFIDYCYRKLLPLLAPSDEEPSADLDVQSRNLEFSMGMTSLSVFRLITDHVESLPLSVVSQLVEQCDIFFVLAQLLEDRPWIKRTENGISLFEDQSWKAQKDEVKVPKAEAQVWMTLVNLFMNAEVRRRYEITPARKSNLLRFRRHLNEVIIDQIPGLSPLHSSLEELNFIEASTSRACELVVQQLPELRERLLSREDWEEIANYQREHFLGDSDEDRTKFSEILMVGVDDNPEESKCSKCGAAATKRCTQCQSEWYCGRACQVQDWPTHKGVCGFFKKV
jgi:hypothetical protein